MFVLKWREVRATTRERPALRGRAHLSYFGLEKKQIEQVKSILCLFVGRLLRVEYYPPRTDGLCQICPIYITFCAFARPRVTRNLWCVVNVNKG